MWQIGSKIERGTKTPLPTDEQEEISPPVDHCYIEETNDDTMGHVEI